MSLLSRFARSKGLDLEAPPEQPVVCVHRELAPRWDNAADIGKKDKIVAYKCSACSEEFTPAEAERIGAA
jgi:hypothetical protein